MDNALIVSARNASSVKTVRTTPNLEPLTVQKRHDTR